MEAEEGSPEAGSRVVVFRLGGKEIVLIETYSEADHVTVLIPARSLLCSVVSRELQHNLLSVVT